MGRLVIIDGNAVLHRAYHAIPHLTDKKGRLTNAVYGFISILLNLITNLKPTHLVVCFDEKEKTFRKKDFAAYQAKRPPMDPGLSSQIELTRDFLKAAGILFYSKGGYEADDIIGTLAKQVESGEVVIVTGDRDIFQLIDAKTKVYVPQKGLSQGKIYGEQEVLAEYDFAPLQMIDYKALVGDASDNYPGVNGIGPKTARDLIVKYKTIENIYANLAQIPEKINRKLKAGRKEAFFFHKIASIFAQVPLDFQLENCSQWQLNSPQAQEFFQELGFKSLSQRVSKVDGQRVTEGQMKLV